MSGGAVLRAKKLKGVGIIRAAAAHNKRAIQAELGAGGSIDASRCGLNECLAGPATAAEVAELARVKMAGAGVTKLRKDAVRAIEFVVSLAPETCMDEQAFFVDAMDWLAKRIGGADNILSADIHRDESTPHLHLLMLPLLGGRMVGSDAFGGGQELRKLCSDFHAEVCAPYGMKRFPPRLTGATKAVAVAAVLDELKRRGDPCLTSALWPAVRDHIEANPGPYVAALGLEVVAVTKSKKLRTSTEIFTSKGKGSSKPESDNNPMGFAKPVCVPAKNQMGFTAPANDRTPSCVGFAPDTAPDPAPQSAPAAPKIVAIVDAVEAASPTSATAPAAVAEHTAPPDASPDLIRERDIDFAAGTWDADTGEFYQAQVITRSNKASARAWVVQARQTVATRREPETARAMQ